MLNVNKIMYELKSNILSSRICISADTKMQGVMFLEKNTVLEKGYIYITDLYTMKEFEFADGSETEVLFLCYGITDGVIEGIGTDISWAYSSLTVEKLYNALHGLFRREDKRQAYFETIMMESRPLDRLMKWIHEELKITAVLLDSSLEIMASVWDERHFKEPFVQQIRKTRKIDNEMFSQYFGVFLQNQKLTDSWAEFECSSEKGRVYRIQIWKKMKFIRLMSLSSILKFVLQEIIS